MSISNIIDELKEIEFKKKQEIDVISHKYNSLYSKKVEELKGKKVRVIKYGRDDKKILLQREIVVRETGWADNVGFFAGLFTICPEDNDGAIVVDKYCTIEIL